MQLFVVWYYWQWKYLVYFLHFERPTSPFFQFLNWTIWWATNRLILAHRSNWGASSQYSGGHVVFKGDWIVNEISKYDCGCSIRHNQTILLYVIIKRYCNKIMERMVGRRNFRGLSSQAPKMLGKYFKMVIFSKKWIITILLLQCYSIVDLWTDWAHLRIRKKLKLYLINQWKCPKVAFRL